MNNDDTQILCCPGCQSELEIDAEYLQELAGSDITCPECDTSVPVPPLESEPAAAKSLGLRSAIPLPAAPDENSGEPAPCPACGADLPDPEAILCVACGTNRLTGEQATGIGMPKPSRQRSRTTPRQAITGIVAVIVILVCAFRAYFLLTTKLQNDQTRELGNVIGRGQVSQDYEAVIASLESTLLSTPRATNRQDAEDLLEITRQNLAQIPAHTEALRTEIARARDETDRTEAIRILNVALRQNPGAQNRDEATEVLRRLRNAP